MDDSKTPKTENHRGKILLACTGSVASIKVPIIVDALLKLKVAEIVLLHLIIYIYSPIKFGQKNNYIATSNGFKKEFCFCQLIFFFFLYSAWPSLKHHRTGELCTRTP